MKKRVIGGLLMASALVLVAGATQLSAPTASAEGIKYTDTTGLIQMIDGASVRVADTTTSGIRFAATMDKAKYDEFEAANGGEDKVCAGIIIIPSDYLGGGNATAFTHEALTAKYGADGYSYSETTSFKLSADGNSYQFAVSLVNMHDYNYARDFVATAYIKVDKDTGAEYTYASFDQDADARNIYEVAHAAYNDRKTAEEGEYINAVEYDGATTYSKMSDDGLKAAKSYMDKIAAITNDGTTATDNDTAYYVSPYQVSGANGSYILDGKGKAPVDVLYNGEIVTTDYITDGDTQVAMVKTSKTTYSGDVATVENGCPPNTNPALVHFDATYGGEDGYVAFNGNYGVGTFIDITFTGNNMPYVTFFADQINGVVCSAGGTGLMTMNGMVSGVNDAIHTRTDVFRVYNSRHNKNFDGATASTGAYAKLTQDALKVDETKQYKLTAGTVLVSGKVNVYLVLADATTGAEITRTLHASTLTTGEGNIILYGCMKGQGTTTQFSYSAPYKQSFTVDSNEIVKSQGAIWNDDGTVSLRGVVAANSNPGNVKLVSNSYVAFDQEYGLGTTVEVEFKGNNMPYVMFLADSINGDMTSNGGVGMLFINGMKTNDASTTYTRDDVWRYWNEYKRMNQNIANAAKPTDESKFTNLTQKYLSEHSATNFKMTIKIYGNGSPHSDGVQGEIVVYRVKLFNMDNNEELIVDTGEQSLGRRENFIKDVLGKDTISGKIVLYANMKGEGECTTFKYTVPTQA